MVNEARAFSSTGAICLWTCGSWMIFSCCSEIIHVNTIRWQGVRGNAWALFVAVWMAENSNDYKNKIKYMQSTSKNHWSKATSTELLNLLLIILNQNHENSNQPQNIQMPTITIKKHKKAINKQTIFKKDIKNNLQPSKKTVGHFIHRSRCGSHPTQCHALLRFGAFGGEAARRLVKGMSCFVFLKWIFEIFVFLAF